MKLFFIFFILFNGLLAGATNINNPETDPAIQQFIGTWTGHGAGEEVRYRHKKGLLTLIVKHETEFVFVVDKNGKISGEGTIKYDLTNNSTGLDNLVAGVHALMGLAKTPSTKGHIPGKAVDQMRDVKGVTKIQYQVPHLKNGVELRHFKFSGQLKVGETRALVELEMIKNFSLPDGSADNNLVAEYEVNRVKYNPKFPCWSPFLKNPGIIRKGPGTLHVAEFLEKGKNREGKKVWEDYSYIWMARQITTRKD